MLNRAMDAVTDHSWIPSSAWRRLRCPEQRRVARKQVDFLDDVPVMSSTVLGLEILLHEPCIDLQMASDLVLSDVGATIQILRLVGSEFDFSSEQPSRMVDCIASLEAGTWFDAISARTFACDAEHVAITSLWNHCRRVAQYARLVAESLEDTSPEEAYLVGLLHGIRTIPKLLGWPNDALFAMEGSLPLFVLAAIRSTHDSSSSSVWRFILPAAHELAAYTDFDQLRLHDFRSVAAVCTCS
jgi:hypothetical protein